MVKVSLKETIICQKVKKPAVKLLFLKNPFNFSFTKEIPSYLKITNLEILVTAVYPSKFYSRHQLY